MANKLSHSPYLRLISAAFGTIYLGFGINGLLNPRKSLEVFKLPYPPSDADRLTADTMVLLYSVKEVFAAAAIYAAALWGGRDRRPLGAITIMGGLCAFADGWVCRVAGTGGEWDHWGYAPVMTVVGFLLMGVLDGA